jgi:hypothetical protein
MRDNGVTMWRRITAAITKLDNTTPPFQLQDLLIRPSRLANPARKQTTASSNAPCALSTAPRKKLGSSTNASCCSATSAWYASSRCKASSGSRRSRRSIVFQSKVICLEGFARQAFGRAGPAQLRRATFVLAEVPIAAVRGHLERREPPPLLVDELIATTYRAIVRPP